MKTSLWFFFSYNLSNFPLLFNVPQWPIDVTIFVFKYFCFIGFYILCNALILISIKLSCLVFFHTTHEQGDWSRRVRPEWYPCFIHYCFTSWVYVKVNFSWLLQVYLAAFSRFSFSHNCSQLPAIIFTISNQNHNCFKNGVLRIRIQRYLLSHSQML